MGCFASGGHEEGDDDDDDDDDDGRQRFVTVSRKPVTRPYP
jgi:hypothetical protein